MRVEMRRSMGDGLTAAAGLCALLIGLAAIDDRVRGPVSGVLSGRGPSGELATVGSRLQELVLVVIQAMRDQSIEHAPLVIFAVVAAVLVVFMLRT